jgi:hypothetical protein
MIHLAPCHYEFNYISKMALLVVEKLSNPKENASTMAGVSLSVACGGLLMNDAERARLAAVVTNAPVRLELREVVTNARLRQVATACDFALARRMALLLNKFVNKSKNEIRGFSCNHHGLVPSG